MCPKYKCGNLELGMILLSSITQEILAYLTASLLERSADHCCKCLIGKKQLMLTKITAYHHQVGKMVIIQIVWTWSEYYTWEWSVTCELQISGVIFVDAVSYPDVSLS